MSLSQSGHSGEPNYPPPSEPKKMGVGKIVAICVSSVVGAVILGFALFPVVLIGGNSLFWWAVSEKQPYYNVDRALEAIGYDSSMAIDEERTASFLAPSYYRANLTENDGVDLINRIDEYVKSDKYASCYGPVNHTRATCEFKSSKISVGPGSEKGEYYFTVSDSTGGAH